MLHPSITNYQLHQMLGNDMVLYQRRVVNEAHMDPANLVAMQHALHSLFDAGEFVIAPKGGDMVIYFLKEPLEGAALHHNPTTDLSIQYLYARFAWAIFKLASWTVPQGQKRILLEGGHGGGGGQGGGGGGGGAYGGGNGGGGNGGGGSGGGENGGAKRPASGGFLTPKKTRRVSDEFTAVDSEREEKDQELAKTHFPFFLNDGDEATPWQYEHLMWYPGRHHADRLRKAYLDSNPNVRACSEPGTRVVPGDDVLELTGSGVLSEDEDEDALE
ncbi:hypothetical protein BOTBODRAFT_244207 [Botryobasidium botryosum FD-172 SS1]|uniref:HNH nuclease domain-containing protein n=1 Tax=Botryobasidium botryosum (strain FD-172 SS1) TaxID=930990 RepID=A0A067M526_BOTB1|nr:hypothetical protein BOTBODRAFT_244207 [Botryobasidium botryosum FD-172 SS1]